jgi:hypothetical protein
MWLLDANMDVHLAGVLQEMGIECDTAANRGWKTLTNGDLVAHAIAADSEGCRSAFRGDGDHDSELMPITIPR